MMNMDEQKRISLDRMRYTKDGLSSGLVLLAIVFNVLYFVSIYQQDHPVVKLRQRLQKKGKEERK